MASPGNDLFPAFTPMRQPQFRFLYRMQCQIAKEVFVVGAPHGTGWNRNIMNILEGKVRGPNIEAEILPGGADCAQMVEGTHVGRAHTELSTHLF